MCLIVHLYVMLLKTEAVLNHAYQSFPQIHQTLIYTHTKKSTQNSTLSNTLGLDWEEWDLTAEPGSAKREKSVFHFQLSKAVWDLDPRKLTSGSSFNLVCSTSGALFKTILPDILNLRLSVRSHQYFSKLTQWFQSVAWLKITAIKQ